MSNRFKNNQRRNIRVKPDTDAPIRIDLVGKDYIEVTTAADVSLDGVGISVPHGFVGYNLENLAKLLVQLPDPVKHSFSATVRVIHHQGTHFGVEFDRIGHEDFIKLHNYIAQLLKNDGWATRIKHYFASYSHDHQVD